MCYCNTENYQIRPILNNCKDLTSLFDWKFILRLFKTFEECALKCIGIHLKNLSLNVWAVAPFSWLYDSLNEPCIWLGVSTYLQIQLCKPRKIYHYFTDSKRQTLLFSSRTCTVLILIQCFKMQERIKSENLITEKWENLILISASTWEICWHFWELFPFWHPGANMWFQLLQFSLL